LTVASPDGEGHPVPKDERKKSHSKWRRIARVLIVVGGTITAGTVALYNPAWGAVIETAAVTTAVLLSL
jgi:hypothetical protein